MRRARLVPLVVLLMAPAAAWPQGSPLGPEFRVNTYTLSDQVGPSVARGAAGDFVVVWKHRFPGGAAAAVQAQRYASSGVPLGSEFRVNTYALSYQGLPAVSMDGGGNFVVVWASSQDGSGAGVVGQRYDASGGPLGSEFRVNTYTTGPQDDPDVAYDPAGSFVVVWSGSGQGSGVIDVFGQRYAASGAPLGTEFRVNTATTGCQYAASVAADAAGNFIVAWQDDVAGGSSCPPGSGIFAQRYASSGSPLGPEFRVNTYTSGSQGSASVAVDSGGDFVIFWRNVQSAFWQVSGQRYGTTGAPAGTEFKANTYVGFVGAPDGAMDAAGNFVVVWSSIGQDGSSEGIFGQRYASSGVPSGPEFRINTFTTGSQAIPSVAADDPGNFVVVWQSADQDGSVSGIYGQRFGQIVPVQLMHAGID